MSIASAACAGDRSGGLDRLLDERAARPEGEDPERGDHLGREGDRDDGRSPALLEEGHERRQELLAAGAAGAEAERAPVAEEPLHVSLPERDRLGEDRADGLGERRVPDVDRARQELLAALVRHPDDGRVEIEHLDDGARESIERLVEPQALGERARHLVEGADRRAAARSAASAASRSSPRRVACSWSCAFWTATASCPASAASSAVSCSPAAIGARRVGGEKADDLAARHERNGERRADAARPGSRRRRCQPRVPRDVRNLETARWREGPSARSSSRSATRACGPARPRLAASSSSRRRAAEIDGDPLHAEQLGDALDRGLERVRDRELSRRLHDHLEQRPRALELEREQPRPLAGAQRVSGADAERREPRQLLRLRLLARGME